MRVAGAGGVQVKLAAKPDGEKSPSPHGGKRFGFSCLESVNAPSSYEREFCFRAVSCFLLIRAQCWAKRFMQQPWFVSAGSRLCHSRGHSVSDPGSPWQGLTGSPLACGLGWLSLHVCSTGGSPGVEGAGGWCLLPRCPAVHTGLVRGEFVQVVLHLLRY